MGLYFFIGGPLYGSFKRVYNDYDVYFHLEKDEQSINYYYILDTKESYTSFSLHQHVYIRTPIYYNGSSNYIFRHESLSIADVSRMLGYEQGNV